MKIAINTRIMENRATGIAYYIDNLYTTFTKKYHDYSYVSMQRSSKKSEVWEHAKAVIKKSVFSPLFDLYSCAIIAHKEHADILHGPSHLLPVYKPPGIKYVVTIHDLSFLVQPEHSSSLFNLYYRIAVGMSLKIADAVVTVSKHTRNDVLKYYDIPESKVHAIHSGIQEDFFKPTSNKRSIRQKYFMSVSTHPKRKNIYKVLDAFSQSKLLLKDYFFVLVGHIEDSQQKDLVNYVSKLGLEDKVIFKGYVSHDRLKELYRNAEFVVYPSYYEGFGFPVLEAMASKTPVIASNSSSIPEIMPSTKWLVNPSSSDAICDTMERMVRLSNSKRNALIQKNYKHAMTFTWEKTAHEMNELFKSLL